MWPEVVLQQSYLITKSDFLIMILDDLNCLFYNDNHLNTLMDTAEAAAVHYF